MTETKTAKATNDINPFALELVDVDKADVLELSGVFLPMLQTAQAIADKAMSMVVTDESQTELISECHDMEMKLRKIRTDADKERIALGRSALRKQQAINGHFKVIRFCTEPAEEHLRDQKNFVKLAKEKRLSELSEKRIEQLSELEVDTEFYNLAEMSEDGFQQLLETSKLVFEQRKESEQKAEAERIAREKAEAEEQKCIREENKRLQAEAEERVRQDKVESDKQAKLEKERKVKEEKDLAELKVKQDKEMKAYEEKEAKERKAYEDQLAKERKAKQEVEEKLARELKERQDAEQLAAEQDRLKMERIKEARLAPDKKKLERLAVIITAIEMPEVTSKEAKSIIDGTIELLNKTSNYIKTKSLNL